MKEKRYQEENKSYKKANSIAGGVLLVLIALLCLISLFGGFGGVGGMIKGFLLGFLGVASYGYSFACLFVGILMTLQKHPNKSVKNTLLCTLIFVFGMIIFQVTTSTNLMQLNYGDYLAKCYAVDYTAGGLLYGLTAYPIFKALGETATIVVFSLFMVACAFILAMPLVNKEFTFSFSRKDRASSYKPEATTRESRRSKSRREKLQNVDNPREPSLTMLDEEQEETISQDSTIISYKRYDNDKMANFEGGKRSRFGLNKYNDNNEDTELDENIDIDSALKSEDADLRRKAALQKLYPDKHGGLLNYDGGILDDIRKVQEEVDEEEKQEENEEKYKNINLTDIIRESNTEEGKRRIVNEKLANFGSIENTSEPEKTTEPIQEQEEEEVDNTTYIDQFGVRRRYYGLDLQKTLKKNENKLKDKLEKDKQKEQEKNTEQSKKDNAVYKVGVYDYSKDLNLANETLFNKDNPDTSYRDVFEKEADNNQSNIAEENDRSSANEFNKIHFTDTKPQEEKANEPEPLLKREPFVEPEPIIEKQTDDTDVIDSDIKPKKVDPADYSYDAVSKEEQEKVYDKFNIEKPTGKEFKEFVQQDIDNSPSTIDVNVGEKERRSDFGGTHKTKFENEKSIAFVKEFFGKKEEPEEEVNKEPVKEEKYPYVPKFNEKGGYKYTPPKIDFLKEYSTSYQKADDYQVKGKIIEDTLAGLGFEAKVVSYTQGPAFSRYELEVDATTNLARLVNAKENLSLALASKGSVNIEAPIRGKSLVGVEVPNDKKLIVGMHEVISSQEFFDPSRALSIVLGKDIAGKIHIGDLKDITHMLIAGSTGSGKSVCLNSILTGILYKYSPEDVRLILVDPKRVELSVYNNLPHMLVPKAIIEPDQVISALKWLDREMVRRLDLFSEIGSRDLAGYNKKVKGENKLPRIILVIDEFADIMMQSAKIGTEMEELISRIARMARAVGIHMILATQRPSAEYITGGIKSNIPTRIAFATASNVDSRIILDASGAEKLLGKGDMLFVSRDPNPIRMQCPYLSDDEVATITDYVIENNESFYDERIADEIVNCTIDKPAPVEAEAPAKVENKAKLDAMFLPVLKFLIEDNYKSAPSITKVQREFEMGFPRAAGLLDKMTKMNFLIQDGRKYQLNFTMEQFNEYFGDTIEEDEEE